VKASISFIGARHRSQTPSGKPITRNLMFFCFGRTGTQREHLVAMSPFYSADTNYSSLVHVSDYLKPSLYNNCAVPRFAQSIRNAQSTIFRDLTPEQVLEMHYKILGLPGEPSLDKLPTSGLQASRSALKQDARLHMWKGRYRSMRGLRSIFQPA
jgi:hypothetical protein